MNLYSNPYAPPQSAAVGAPRGDMAGSAEVPDAVLEPLRSTRPWVMFLAILGFVGAGFMVLAGLAVFLMGSLVPNNKLPGAFGLVYVALAAFYVFPSLFLLRYGSAIGRLVREPQMDRLVAALGQQRSFWRFVGIMTAVMLCLYPIGIVIFAVVAVKGAMH